jgi:hypothetical protein
LASYSASSPPSRAAGKSKVFSPNSRLQDVGEGMKREFTFACPQKYMDKKIDV